MDTTTDTTDSETHSKVVELGGKRDVSSWETTVVAAVLTPIIVLGIIGNFFSLLVWVKGRRRSTSTARYLSALAVADILVLSICALDFWVGMVTRQDIRTGGTFICSLLFYMSFLAPALSAWILVCVTVERAMSVWIPHKISVACTPIKAILITIVVALFLFAIYLPLFTGSGLVTVQTRGVTYTMCSLLPHAMIREYYHEWLIIDLCLFFLVPFIIMLVCNISILSKVVCLAKKRRAHLQGGGKINKSAPATKTEKMLTTVTRRVIILTLTYCICTAPLSIFNAIIISDNADDIIEEKDVQIYRIIFHILMYLNSGVNFFLYCMIGSGFRKDFMGIFRPGSRISSS